MRRTKKVKKSKFKRTRFPESFSFGDAPLSEKEITLLCTTLLSNDVKYAQYIDAQIQRFLEKRVPVAGYQEMSMLIELKRELIGVTKSLDINVKKETSLDFKGMSLEELDTLSALLKKAEQKQEETQLTPETVIH